LDLQALIGRCMGNLDFTERILSRFESRCQEELEKLEEIQELLDLEQISFVAHRLKGAAASVSALGIAEVSARLEELARAQRPEGISPCLHRLREEWDRFRAFSASLPRPLSDT